jgi:hypothetical protein
MATIFFNPSKVRWFLFFIMHTTSLNCKKSANFLVIKGYLSKCGITTFKISSKEFTTNVQDSSFWEIHILPVPWKKSWITFKSSWSFLCNPIWNIGWTCQPIRWLALFFNIIINEASASQKPVIAQGFIDILSGFTRVVYLREILTRLGLIWDGHIFFVDKLPTEDT